MCSHWEGTPEREACSFLGAGKPEGLPWSAVVSGTQPRCWWLSCTVPRAWVLRVGLPETGGAGAGDGSWAGAGPWSRGFLCLRKCVTEASHGSCSPSLSSVHTAVFARKHALCRPCREVALLSARADPVEAPKGGWLGLPELGLAGCRAGRTFSLLSFSLQSSVL